LISPPSSFPIIVFMLIKSTPFICYTTDILKFAGVCYYDNDYIRYIEVCRKA